MVSREHEGASLHEKLQLLRSITNSHALDQTSIIVDASKYIEELKEKVERLNQGITSAQSSSNQDPLPRVVVEKLEKGFVVKVYSAKSCRGLLVSILEAFDGMSLNVLEARVSCADYFQLEAVGAQSEEAVESIDAQVVREAVLQAIKHGMADSDQD
ncbi:hypothetical protein Nepgr_006899 [Nepenthes gracilis]|uniref:Plant bHLH transcription factor ACT-like domain-containing protein n=1 Tax=Nepenthes gracilis TaxID=150966 RepID=A0AAD3S620_NEPGR|nr:hypothetical protein Nepgr_006899 [Nepenthes gracilis]